MIGYRAGLDHGGVRTVSLAGGSMTVANAITLVRIVLAPVFIYFFATGARGEALVVFAIAGGSDLIDGTVARLLKQPSTWGALLDPMADKVLLESAFVCLVIAGVVPLWFFLLAFGRDLMIVGGIIYLRVRRIPLRMHPLWSSKFATLMQIATIIVGLLMMWRPSLAVASIEIADVLRTSMVMTAMLILFSGALYIRMGLKILKGQTQGGGTSAEPMM